MGEPGPDFYILIQIEFSKKASYKLPAPDSRSDLSAGIRSAVDRLYRRAAGATGRGEAPTEAESKQFVEKPITKTIIDDRKDAVKCFASNIL